MAGDVEELWTAWFSGLQKMTSELAAKIRNGSDDGHDNPRQKTVFDGELVTKEAGKTAAQNETIPESTMEDLWKTWYSGVHRRNVRNNDLITETWRAFDGGHADSRQKSVFDGELVTKEAKKG